MGGIGGPSQPPWITRRLTPLLSQILAFGTDSHGEVYLADPTTLYRLRAEGQAAVVTTEITVEEGDTALVRVRRDGDGEGSLFVDYRTFPESAAPNDDYLASEGTVSWADGETGEKTFGIPTVEDPTPEETETFTVRLLARSPGDAGTPRVAEVTILDDDAPESLCIPDEHTVCLLDYRFAVTVEQRTEGGPRRPAAALPLTDDTGYFWFFSPANVELVVKVLDGCAVPGFDAYWVFAAGLTDVEVRIRVEDRLTGDVYLHQSPLGTPFRALQDTNAFPTCDAGP